MDTSYPPPVAAQPFPQRPVHQRPTTGTWGWVALVFGTLVVSVPADLFISLVFSSSCGQPADPTEVLHGRVAMLVVLLVAALPWLVAVPMTGNRSRGVVLGLVALLPGTLFLLHGFTAGAWTSSLCLGG
jgi:hypothetical protein